MSDTCKNCGKNKDRHILTMDNEYICPTDEWRHFEPIDTGIFTDAGIISDIFSGGRVDAHVTYPDRYIYVDKAIYGGIDMHAEKYLSDTFYREFELFAQKKYTTQIEAWAKKKTEELE